MNFKIFSSVQFLYLNEKKKRKKKKKVENFTLSHQYTYGFELRRVGEENPSPSYGLRLLTLLLRRRQSASDQLIQP